MNPKPTFEEALQRLEAIAEQIERGQIGLEESIARYEEGVQLIRHCRDVLARAELRVQQLQIDDQGKVESRPFPVAAPPTAGDAPPR
ncbi:MAG: exodeoxyribonuclease VII small subunit [Phycisphaerae bacterium]|nr:MAG: exodeoxyribonuclease VII small subunit [Planctomycetota bacterium]KAB2946377.1 MAG: exodeoxyribonuclease VII small subunit [Phycisphaerae bacterium]MBE7457270.1 exodeoxyribonuclease VII small subunit [Planctomycetia bacterium]MCK6465486.1 exodeoxyribonuclease VII small subunit [Phycisphaerae bacterium]MCL4719121.1 exodeoxyribonuclease VII small subunit [Phycisphaerae bacterium]